MNKKPIIKFENVSLDYKEADGSKKSFNKMKTKFKKKIRSKLINVEKENKISKIINLTLLKEKNTLSLDNVSFNVYEGEFVALIGKSGAGKTTIINILNGRYVPNKGKIIVYNRTNLLDLDIKQQKLFRKTTATIFQHYDLIPNQKIIDTVLTNEVPEKPLVERLLKIYSKEEKQRAYEIISELGMLEQADKKIFELSGGEKQRVAISRAIARRDVKIFLADEPVSALDPSMLKVVMDMIRKANIERGITTITNLHHIEVAVEYADRIIGIKKGKIVYDGKAVDITIKDLKNIYGSSIEGLSQQQINHAVKLNKKWKK